MAAQGAALRVLGNDDTLLRALLKRAQLDDPRTAFLIRNDERDTGLSVNFDLTPEECRAYFDTTYGIRSLLVRCVRDLQLEIVPDEPHHANVTGIPHSDDDPKRAEFLAGELSKISVLVSEGKIKTRNR
jgi:hypothetical protein